MMVDRNLQVDIKIRESPRLLSWSFDRVSPDEGIQFAKRALPVEAPIAVAFNALGYAMLMATPNDLADLAYGFALLERVRSRVSASSCGPCGIEILDQALPMLSPTSEAEPHAIFRALNTLPDFQTLNRDTGTVHVAALSGPDGEVRLVREGVSRHNAFDKLISAMLREGLGWDGGFARLTSCCSYELVEKAVLAGCPLLATISAPTSPAAERANAAGLARAVLARSDAVLTKGAPSDG